MLRLTEIPPKRGWLPIAKALIPYRQGQIIQPSRLRQNNTNKNITKPTSKCNANNPTSPPHPAALPYNSRIHSLYLPSRNPPPSTPSPHNHRSQNPHRPHSPLPLIHEIPPQRIRTRNPPNCTPRIPILNLDPLLRLAPPHHFPPRDSLLPHSFNSPLYNLATLLHPHNPHDPSTSAYHRVSPRSPRTRNSNLDIFSFLPFFRDNAIHSHREGAGYTGERGVSGV